MEAQKRQNQGRAFGQVYDLAWEKIEEFYHDRDGLEEWTTEFCDAHEWLWNKTLTPSVYRFRQTRNFFGDILKAWRDDNVLIRFAIRLETGRVVFVAGLTSNKRLIYHHSARVPPRRRPTTDSCFGLQQFQ